MSTEYAIRSMTPSDVKTVKEIVDSSFQPFVRFFAYRSLKEEGKVLVSATQEGIVVGFAKLIKFRVGAETFGCILWIAVHPQFRRKGIASSLVEAGLDSLKQEGSEAVFASVRRRNIASLTTFRKQGFGRIGFLKLWSLFSWRTFEFYRDIWFAPGEVVLMHY